MFINILKTSPDHPCEVFLQKYYNIEYQIRIKVNQF
jgi:hypothetical protein